MTPFIPDTAAENRIKALRHDVKILEAVITIALELRQFDRDERAVIVRRVKDALGCPSEATQRSSGMGC